MQSSKDLSHTFQGRSFSPDQLLHLPATFRDAYLQSIQRYGPQYFLKCYEGSHVTEKTFEQFDSDVRFAILNIQSKLRNEKIFVSLGSNTYKNAVYMVAALLSNLTLCPMNADEDASSLQAKVKALPFAASVWCDSEPMATSVLNPQTMTLATTGTPSSKIPILPLFPKDQAMVYIFTSGSTGYSKVVEQMEDNILTNVDALIEHHDMSEPIANPTCIATSLPLFHVNALEFSFFASLLSGNRLVLYRKFDLATVSRSLEQDSVNILSLIPTLLRVMNLRSKDFLSATKKSLRYVVTAAAPLSTEVAAEFVDTFQIRILQGYGLSEAVNFSAVLPNEMSIAENRFWLTNFQHPSIGPALCGNEIHILNSSGTACKAGEVGEVCLRGWNVMRKYADSNPSELFKDGFFHTGDLGYFHEDQTGKPYYFISGRIKDVIKRNGHTVSLREVDDCVQGVLPPGCDAISVGFTNDSAGEELGLIVLLDDPQRRRTLLESLSQVPSHLRPAVVIFQSASLRTPSGKPQRWKFVSLFETYKTSFLGAKIKVGGSDESTGS